MQYDAGVRRPTAPMRVTPAFQRLSNVYLR
jgi:hypothetical protein